MTHVRTVLHHGSKIFTALVALALVFTWTTQQADAHHEPANKFAAAGAALDDVDPNTEKVVLSETMRVSTPFDLALSATAECSILTYLRSAGGPNVSSETSNAEGRVEMWIEIDGKPVPVQTGDIDPQATGVQNDNGEVTFCNREYERTIVDREENEGVGGNTGGDGIDEERDFIRTRNANAFNWFALDVGANYDKPNVPAGSGKNVVLIELHARYTKEGAQPCRAATQFAPGQAVQEDCSDAFVGKRTLVAEPTNASVHEVVQPQGGAGS